jgi:hypothetical protein
MHPLRSGLLADKALLAFPCFDPQHDPQGLGLQAKALAAGRRGLGAGGDRGKASVGLALLAARLGLGLASSLT